MKKILITIFIATSLFAFGGGERGYGNPNGMGGGMGGKSKFLNFNYRMIHFIPHFVDFEDFDLTKEQMKELLLINYEFTEVAKKFDDKLDPLFMMDENFNKDEYVKYHSKVISDIINLKADTFDKILKVLNDKQKAMFFKKLKNLDSDMKDKREKFDRIINGGR